MVFHTDLYYILCFFIFYCICGWIWESSYCSVKARKWINRGFLLGPYIPIYGTGALIIYLMLFPYRDQLWVVFAGGVLLATGLEFFTSWIMEKLFHATWWDYSQEKFNIQGRICLKSSICWGFFSVAMIELVHPAVQGWIEKIPRRTGEIFSSIFLVVFLADLVYTAVASFDAKKTLVRMESIRRDIDEFLEVHRFGREFQKLRPAAMLERMKEEWEERLEFLENISFVGTISEYREELEEKLSELVKVYETNKPKYSRVLKHHLKAYPKLRSIQHPDAFKEVKSQLEKIRKEK